MTIHEASEKYNIPIKILQEYESMGLCVEVKKVMGSWHYDDSDIERLQNAAQNVLTENGFDYGVRVEIGKDYFNTRTYDGEVTLPAGEYEAVRVILGEGKGQNWWCVMFPPMCLPAAEADTEISDVLTQNEEDVVKSNPKYEARFKIVELFENFYRKIK